MALRRTARWRGPREWVIVATMLVGTMLVAGVARAQEAPPVEPPDPGALHELCARGADALWRGRVAEAEALAREALSRWEERAPSELGVHARARCEALLGRAILARGSRDPAVHAEAGAALRRAWSLAPSPDLVDDLVASHWLGEEPSLPPIALDPPVGVAAMRAAARVVTGRTRALSLLRSVEIAGGTRWSLVLARGRRASQLVLVGCRALAACSAEVVADTARESVRLASFGFVASRTGMALVVELDCRRALPEGAAWEGTRLHVRWWSRSGLAGWNLLTRSRARAWSRALGPRPPSTDVRVRWVRRRVGLSPRGSAAIEALRSWTGLRDPESLACERCWLGSLRPPVLP